MEVFKAWPTFIPYKAFLEISLLEDSPLVINDSHRSGCTKLMEPLEQECRRLEFKGSMIEARKILGLLELPGSTYGLLAKSMEHLQTSLLNEMTATPSFVLSTKENGYYQNPCAGWEAIIARFPDTQSDIEEAGKCFALCRYTASVFHSLQIVEVGVIELGMFLGVKDPNPGWTATTNSLKKTLETKYQLRSDFERQHSGFIEQVHGTTEALKNAWRNKISHAHGKLILLGKDFPQDKSEEILFASRAFMRRLLEGLPREREGL